MNPNATNGQGKEGISLDEQIQQKETAKFMADFDELQKKYKRVLIPIINTSSFGIYPGHKVFTMDQYAAMMNKLVTPMAAAPEQKG